MYNRNLLFAVACTGMLLFGITLITLGAVLPDLQAKLRLDEMAAGTLFAILPFGILAGSLVFGYWCDRFGYKSLLVVSCLLIAAGLMGISILHQLHWLQVCVFVFGFGGGCVNGATNALVADISEKHKGANLALLGVFFAVGALGMPLGLGLLKHRLSFENILLGVSLMAILIGIVIAFLRFPPAKTLNAGKRLPVRDLLLNSTLLLIAFFLFFQSSLEAIVHNWITTYLNEDLQMAPQKALYALTLNVVGMAVMRLLMGTVLRTMRESMVLALSLFLLASGSLLILFTHQEAIAIASLILIGAGLAAGFPVMYAIVGRLHTDRTATAFSIILTIALIGNMLVNYLMGIIARNYGIQQVPVVIFVEVLIMLVLFAVIFRKEKSV
jgi:fucose permease